MQTQPRFAVVTFVLVALCALAALSRLLSPYIVAPSNKRLLNAESTYLQAALRQHVAWYPLSEKAFQDARRLDRPILLVIGAPWSVTGRRMDAAVFSSQTIEKLLSREFVCIRVDSVETPDWVASYLPVSRATLGLSSDFQIWMLDSQARLFRAVAQGANDSIPSETQFDRELASDLTDLQVARNAEFNMLGSVSIPGAIQADDLHRLFAPPNSLSPNLAAYRQQLLDLTSSNPSGGFLVGHRQRLWPSAWSFLLAVQGPDAAAASVDGLLKSPTTDLLDGGFFYGASDPNWRTPAFDKVAVLNAEMCVLMAQLAIAKPSGPYGRFAQATFDSLAGEFIDSEGLIRPCRIGDEQGSFARSSRSSFSPKQLRSLLPLDERNWAYQNLNLRPTADAVVTPFVSDFDVLGTADFNQVMDGLRGASPIPPFDHEVTLSSMGPAAARLLQAARLMQDPVRLQKASDIVGKLELFREGDYVSHELTPSSRAQPVLGDYLGYSDAALEDFLSSGRVASLQAGASALRRGLALFAIPDKSCFAMAKADSSHHLAPDSNSPQLCDDTGESTTAKAIRLAWSYSALLAGSGAAADKKVAAELRSKATAAVAQFADVIAGLGPFVGGFANAAALVNDNTVVLCAGLDPVKMANAMSAKCPIRLVAPVAGPVYPELFKKPGYYLSREGHLIGPLSLEAITPMLSPTLFVSG